ncbi:hypothetical protein [Ornithinibacillus halotolerans]|uniref:Uncharacterized protein n=1 Tax=Ornithinibacillus halotolerans TaxID=1274357 RepID=A0A916W2W4_9BACI|nr:hypothetical protein [Ornithinibacillus halotolerans]GGA61917.1 hypothetical protein GCM10008025_02330 [Ornithinibacillus halotolerans]
MEKVKVCYISSFDKVINGKYIQERIAYKLDNHHVVEFVDGYIAINQITGNTDDGVVIDISKQTTLPILITIENTQEFTINHPTVSNFLSYLVEHKEIIHK